MSKKSKNVTMKPTKAVKKTHGPKVARAVKKAKAKPAPTPVNETVTSPVIMCESIGGADQVFTSPFIEPDYRTAEPWSIKQWWVAVKKFFSD